MTAEKVFRYALIVGLAAFIGWLMVEPINRGQERAKIDAVRAATQNIFKDIEGLSRSDPPDSPGDVFRSMRDAQKKVEQLQKKHEKSIKDAGGNPYLTTALIMSVVGMMMGLGLALADEFGSFSAVRIAMRSVIGAGTGMIGGLLAGVMGQLIFDLMLPGGGLGPFAGMIIFARTAGWAFAGMAVGAAVGVAKGSKSLVIQGMVGGAIGGGIGGLFFDALSSVGAVRNIFETTGYHYATVGRLFAGTLMGAAIGAAVAMIQEYSKQAWVTVLAGKNEGKDYILTKPSTSVGRDELADIPLFGDKSVEKRHAVIEEHMGTHVLNASGPVNVNNLPVKNAQLHHGDLINIGKFTLKFTTRSLQALSSYSSLPSQPNAQTQSYQPVAYPAGTQLVPRLRAVGGMLNGVVFDISSCQITIGRDTSNAISLSQDTSVSRRHAEIIYENGQYILRDAGSTNGIFVNGQKVSEASITPADVIQIGATQFRLVFEAG